MEPSKQASSSSSKVVEQLTEGVKSIKTSDGKAKNPSENSVSEGDSPQTGTDTATTETDVDTTAIATVTVTDTAERTEVVQSSEEAFPSDVEEEEETVLCEDFSDSEDEEMPDEGNCFYSIIQHMRTNPPPVIPNDYMFPNQMTAEELRGYIMEYLMG